MTTYYKLLNADGTTPQLRFPWSLPTKKDDGWKPGRWLPKINGPLVACEHGYHVLAVENLLSWSGDLLIVVEVRGAVLDAETKVVCREARAVSIVETWNARNGRLLAADFAKHVLPIFERLYPAEIGRAHV